jgi:hypothetical protein
MVPNDPHTLTETSHAFVEDLRAALNGAVDDSALTRGLYSTDASNYRVVPRAVLTPHSRDDVVAAVRIGHGESDDHQTIRDPEPCISLFRCHALSASVGCPLVNKSVASGCRKCARYCTVPFGNPLRDAHTAAAIGVVYMPVSACITRSGGARRR